MDIVSGHRKTIDYRAGLGRRVRKIQDLEYPDLSECEEHVQHSYQLREPAASGGGQFANGPSPVN